MVGFKMRANTKLHNNYLPIIMINIYLPSLIYPLTHLSPLAAFNHLSPRLLLMQRPQTRSNLCGQSMPSGGTGGQFDSTTPSSTGADCRAPSTDSVLRNHRYGSMRQARRQQQHELLASRELVTNGNLANSLPSNDPTSIGSSVF